MIEDLHRTLLIDHEFQKAVRIYDLGGLGPGLLYAFKCIAEMQRDCGEVYRKVAVCGKVKLVKR